MKHISSAAKTLLDFINKHRQHVTFEEIERWSSPSGYVHGEQVDKLCEELVREGLIKQSVAGGLILYSTVKK